MAVVLLHTFWGVIFFDACERRRYWCLGVVVASHLATSGLVSWGAPGGFPQNQAAGGGGNPSGDREGTPGAPGGVSSSPDFLLGCVGPLGAFWHCPNPLGAGGGGQRDLSGAKENLGGSGRISC